MRTLLFLAILVFTPILPASANNHASPCLACAVPGGLLASDVTATSATLSWTAVPGATKYTVEIEDEQVVPSVLHIETSVSGTTYALSGLQAGVAYKFKVRSNCNGDKSDWSDWVFFKAGSTSTGGGGGSGACDVPTGLTVSLSADSAVLAWTAVPGALQYTIEIEDEQNTPSTFHLEVKSTGNSYTFTGMQAKVLYKFKVRTQCGGTQSDWSAWLFFNGKTGGTKGGGNGSCSAPAGLIVTNITATTAVLEWAAVPGVSAYTVEVERGLAGASPWKLEKAVAGNSLALTDLVPEARYKFKVRSKCAAGGHSDWSDWRKFKTAATLLTPDPAAEDRANLIPAAANNFSLYAWPNPAASNTTIRLQTPSAEPVTLRLLDLAGRVAREEVIRPEAGTWEGSLNLEQLPRGLYLLQAADTQHVQTLKLVVHH